MASHEERTAEIWSTRIQRELLALTTENADADTTQEVRSMLPPFVTVKEHSLSIEQGSCNVSFEVEITGKKAEEGEEPGSSSFVVVTLEASLPKKDDGSIDTHSPSYPFVPPIATLTSGQSCFPAGSTIKDGDRLNVDLDWTPSLHLTDAILNIGLKIRESVLQLEPFHPAPEPEIAPVDEVARSARRFASSLTQKASASLKALTPRNKSSPRETMLSPTIARPPSPTATSPPSPITPGEVKIGDEVNLAEEPWVHAHGVYPCKALRRPAFVEDAIEYASQREEQQAFKSPKSMFRSFTQSARSVLEESFLMVTETHIIELKANRLNLTTGTVSFAIPIEMLAKLKFRRQESISLFFKPAPDDPMIYMCPDSGEAVQQIQAVLKRHGVRGKHTNAAAFRAINEALQLVQEIQTKELALKHDPTVERVNEIMDLYRQAAERFEVAGDLRHEEVVVHMRKFLALPLTVSILDGSFKKREKPKPAVSATVEGSPEGEVLERTRAQLEDHDLDGPTSKAKEKESDKEFEDSMDSLLKEAKEDLEKLKMDGDDTLETDAPSGDSSEDSGLADVAADLDAMMKEADKELAALMSS